MLPHPSHTLSSGNDFRGFSLLLLPGCGHPALLPPHLPLPLAEPYFHNHPSSQIPAQRPHSSSSTGSWWEDFPLHTHLKSGVLGLSHARQEHLALAGHRCRSSLH